MIDKNGVKNAIRDLLVAFGENPNREGLKDTPRRVAEMYEELLVPSSRPIYTMFESEQYDGLVLVKDIDFSSLCEHHMMPFVGKASIAYIPTKKVLGISKLARIVDKYAKNLQLQERLSNQIANDILNATNAKGVAVYMEASHLCMNIRGITRRNAKTVTTVFLGAFKEFKLQEMFMDMLK